MWVKQAAIPKSEALRRASVGYALASPTNIRLGYNILWATNTLVYCSRMFGFG